MNHRPRTPEKFKLEKDAVVRRSLGGIDAQLQPGQILARRYRVISLIGHGGMGSVYKVEQILLNKVCALKTLNAAKISDDAWRRFQYEAKAAALLDHPCLIKVLDMGLIDDEHPFFTMELAAGQPLANMLKNGPLPLDMVLEIFHQLALALGYAHSQGVIHRDLKPSNIIIQPANETDELKVKVVDFGIAKVIGRDGDTEATNLTKTGEIFGTPNYMSPEQCMGRAIDDRADIYSLGCVLFESLTGNPPFISDTALSTMLKHQSEPAPTLKEATLGGSYPQDLELVISKLLAKHPGQRYQTLLDLAYDLSRIKLGERVDRTQYTTISGLTRVRTHWPTIAAATGVLLIGIAGWLGFIAGRNEPMFQSTQTGQNETLAKNAKDWMDMPAAVDETQSIKVTQQYFSSPISSPQGEIRYFNFPKQSSLGVIRLTDPKSGFYAKKANQYVQSEPLALGEVLITNFHPVGLRVDPAIGSTFNATILSKFRPDDLSILNFDTTFECSDAHMKAIEHCTSLRGVFLAQTRGLTNVSVDSLNKLPQLCALDLDTSGIDTDGLLRLKRLKQLSFLNIKKFEDGGRILDALAGSHQIRYLFIRQTDASQAQLQKLGTMTNLTALDLGRNQYVQNETIKTLGTLPHLERLSLFGCPAIQPDSIADFKKLVHLKKLYLESHPKGWTNADFSRLQAAMPNCSIEFSTQAPMMAVEISLSNFLSDPNYSN
jgi:serine/threonine protein kinase